MGCFPSIPPQFWDLKQRTLIEDVSKTREFTSYDEECTQNAADSQESSRTRGKSMT